MMRFAKGGFKFRFRLFVFHSDKAFH